jgi:glucose/arabinose dehydrogenase
LKRYTWFAVFASILISSPVNAKTGPKVIVDGLKNPSSIAVGVDGKTYVTTMGEIGKDGDGAVYLIEGSKAVKFAEGLDDPQGIVTFADWLFVADKKQVWRIDKNGKATVLAATPAFPTEPSSLAAIEADEFGNLYVADGDGAKSGNTIFRIDPMGKVTIAVDSKRTPELKSPAGITMDGFSFLLVSDAGSGDLLRIKLVNGKAEKLAESSGGSVAWDRFGRLYLGDPKGGRISVIPRPGEKPIQLVADLPAISGMRMDFSGKSLLLVDAKAGTVNAISATVPGQEVDETPLPLETAIAFPNLEWTGWKPENDKGQVTPFRPIFLTHAGDGSDRVFVPTEQGVIHVFPNDQKATKTKIFLDLQDRVVYDDNQNEEGFLGLAFHPNYKKNGEFFVFYTTKTAKLTNVISRFRVSKDDPDRADPASEEVLLTIKKPFWNHDGGTICFGPDGYLYFAHGDGGLANDPFNNGQNLKSLLGKVCRIDVDHKDKGLNYAIPKDNPFVNKEGARPEIWAYGLRNVWRMAFDKKTGKLWASDVGQNLYEEIDILVPGGNYGWNLREGLHPFGDKGVGPRKDLIEPIWEYHHDIGKSLTGGCVYRGSRLKELEGAYLYADYVSSKIWALRYDNAKKRVVANQPIRDPKAAVMSFGEDEKGEVYFMTYSATGKGIYWFVKAGK